MIDTAVTVVCKKGETAVALADAVPNSGWVAAAVGNTAQLFDTGAVAVSLQCISNNATTTNTGITFTATGQFVTLLVSFHNPGTSGTTVQTLHLWSQQASAGHNNQCFEQGQWFASYT